MNYLDGYVEEILSEPYYDDYGSIKETGSLSSLTENR